jgi:hypothetical protein
MIQFFFSAAATPPVGLRRGLPRQKRAGPAALHRPDRRILGAEECVRGQLIAERGGLRGRVLLRGLFVQPELTGRAGFELRFLQRLPAIRAIRTPVLHLGPALMLLRLRLPLLLLHALHQLPLHRVLYAARDIGPGH